MPSHRMILALDMDFSSLVVVEVNFVLTMCLLIGLGFTVHGAIETRVIC